MSLPSHVGNEYSSGILPAVCFAVVAETGDVYASLWYPMLIAAVSCLIGFVFIRETHTADTFAAD